MTVATAPFRAGIERAKILTSETRGVCLEISEGEFKITSNNPDVGDVVETIDVDYRGSAIRWGCNPVYLLQLIDEIDAESITISFDPKSGLSPALVRSTDDAAMRTIHDASILGVIMPMRL